MRSLLMGFSRRARRRTVRAGACRRELSRVAIDKPAPASTVEGPPLAFWLSQPVGDRIERGWMSAKADVARVNYDVFGKFATRFYAALPGDNPISAAPDRRRRHGRRSPQQPVKIMRTDSVAACKLIQTPSIRLPRMSGERRAQRYDETHHFGRLFGQF